MQESKLKELGDELLSVTKELAAVRTEFEQMNQRAIELTARANALGQQEQRIKVDLIEALGIEHVDA